MAEAKQDLNNGPSQQRVVLAKPRLGGFGSSVFGASGSNKLTTPFGSILHPPQLKPASINPFVKSSQENEKEMSKEESKTTVSDSDKEQVNDTTQDDVEVPKFVPLGSANVISRTTSAPPVSQSSSSTATPGFVFGQNLSDRVLMSETVNNGEAITSDHSSSNGTNELLFASAVATAKENNQVSNDEEASGSEIGASEGLAAAAAEYERSHARPCPQTTNFTITGEEGEVNILQISCRLFAWEGGSWRERGRGVLRLNDGTGGSSRLVARVVGSLRVVLNTKLWPNMVLELAGAMSLRITAMDAQHQVKLFLIMGSPGDVTQLYRAMQSRVAASTRTFVPHKSTQDSSERLESQSANQEAALQLADKYNDDYELKENTPLESSHATGDDLLKDRCHSNKISDRLEESEKDETDAKKDDSISDVDDSRSLKRKEHDGDNETSPKRQCPTVLIQ